VQIIKHARKSQEKFMIRKFSLQPETFERALTEDLHLKDCIVQSNCRNDIKEESEYGTMPISGGSLGFLIARVSCQN